MLKIVRTKKELRETIQSLRAGGKTIALVPTMGALHEGHISLVETAFEHADSVIASIFINPSQFGPNEDFSKYPRTEAADIRKLEAAGTAVAYVPNVEEMYGEGAATLVHLKGVSEELCGAFRPGHFDGVATIVTKLFMQAQPDIAVFGEKDYQQLHIIRQFVYDLDIPVRIIGAKIVRESDGLAMSSRNRYLNEQERKTAAMLYRILQQSVENIKEGRQIGEVIERAKELLLAGGFSKIDYLELRDAATLQPATDIKKPARLLAAAYLGKTRLIDNIEI